MKQLVVLMMFLFSTFVWGAKGFDNVYITNGLAVGTASAPATSALLDLVSTSKGLMLPRMSTAQRNAIGSPTQGLLIFNTDVGSLDIYTASGSFTSIASASFAGTINLATQTTGSLPFTSMSGSATAAQVPALSSLTGLLNLSSQVSSSLPTTALSGNINLVNQVTGSLPFTQLSGSATAAQIPAISALTGLLNLSSQTSSSLPFTATSGQLPVNRFAAQTASKAAVYDASGFLAPSITTAVELSYVSGATTNLQAQINAITTASGAISQLTGDVTAGPGSGSQAATVALVGGVSAASVAATVNLSYVSPITKIGTNVQLASVPASYLSGTVAASNLPALSAITGALNLATQTSGSLPNTALNTVTVPFGGTGKSSWNVGDILFASTATTLAAIPGAGNVNDVLTRLGTASYGFTTPAAGSSGWYVDATIIGTSGQQELGSSAQTAWTVAADHADFSLANASWPSATVAKIACASGEVPSGATCSTNETLGLGFIPGTTCDFEVCADFTHYMNTTTGVTTAVSNIDATFALIETPSNAVTVTNLGSSHQNSSFDVPLNASNRSDFGAPHHLCSSFQGSSGFRTIRVAYKKTADSNSNSNAILTFLGFNRGDANVRFKAQCLK